MCDGVGEGTAESLGPYGERFAGGGDDGSGRRFWSLLSLSSNLCLFSIKSMGKVKGLY